MPKAPFAVTGQLQPSTDKSKLMSILEVLSMQTETVDGLQPDSIKTDGCPLPIRKVSVIGGMAVVYRQWGWETSVNYDLCRMG